MESIRRKRHKYLAKPLPARLALQLEARPTQFTILSNVARQLNTPLLAKQIWSVGSFELHGSALRLRGGRFRRHRIHNG
jgi:hypothetical protein